MRPFLLHPASCFCLPLIVLVAGLALTTLPWAPPWDTWVAAAVCLGSLLALPAIIWRALTHSFRRHWWRWLYLAASAPLWIAATALTLIFVGDAPFGTVEARTLAAPGWPARFFVRVHTCFPPDGMYECDSYNVEIYRQLPVLPWGRKLLDCTCLLDNPQPEDGQFLLPTKSGERVVLDLRTGSATRTGLPTERSVGGW